VVQYEPELYPALIYRLEKPQVKVLVFVSGKVVFTDSKEQRELHAACEAIFPVRASVAGHASGARPLTLDLWYLQILCQFKDPKPVDPIAIASGASSGPHTKTDTSDESHLDD
jgi:hypothetical protein